MTSQQLFEQLDPELKLLNEEIKSQLSSDVPLVEKIAEYIIASGGKRLRPLIVIIVASALGYQDNNKYKLAAVIEFLHTATLLHDDVVDQSDQRRGRPTANARWGNAPSVLVGDFVYSKAFEMLVDLGFLNIMGNLAKSTSIIAEGEVQQLLNIRNPKITEADYMRVIQGKTATLFEASGLCAAYLAQQDEEICTAMKNYGFHLGMAFQIIDDVLDFTGDADTMGKNVGDDLAEGKPTLPMIKAMEFGQPEQARQIHQAISQGGLENLDAIVSTIRDTGALQYCMDMAVQQSHLAIQQLDKLKDSTHKEQLRALAELAVQRQV